jgi:predicted DNA repair protein MutK
MKGLAIAGTAAMFLVGGGILVHGIAPLHHFAQEHGGIFEMLVGAGTGVAAGAIAVAIVALVKRVIAK